jgi:two-component system, NtrC family, nitrogen regulation sensor histidine kinase GlnL
LLYHGDMTSPAPPPARHPAPLAIYAGLDLLASAVLIADAKLVVQFANTAAEALLSLSRKHLLGHSLTRLFAGNGRFLAALEDTSHASGLVEHDLTVALAGETIHASCVVTPLERSGSGWVLELRALDQQLRIDREEKISERQVLNRELLRNLAHEIKNPLGGIRGAAQLLDRELPDPELREFTQVIVAEADRLQALMNRMLAPARLPQVSAVNIHEVLERVRTLLLAEFPNSDSGIRVRRDYDTSLPTFPGDKEQLIQAVLNIARNAAEALAGRGEIVLSSRIARQVTLHRARFKLALVVTVTDNGPGVPAAIAEKIFFPLVSGKETGSGLGLSLAQEYITQHQGVIEFESEPGRTQFFVTLPIRDAASFASNDLRGASRHAPGSPAGSTTYPITNSSTA